MRQWVKVSLGSVGVVAMLATQGLAGGMVGPPPKQILREFGEFSVGSEFTYVASRRLDVQGAEASGADLMAKVAFTVLDRADFELFGGGTYKDINDSATDLEDLGFSEIGGVGVNVNFWKDLITKVEVGCSGRYTACNPGGSRWGEWQFAATLSRPLGADEEFTPYVGAKFSQLDASIDTQSGDRIQFEERQRFGGLLGLGYTFKQRYEVLGEVHFVDETSVSLGFRMMF